MKTTPNNLDFEDSRPTRKGMAEKIAPNPPDYVAERIRQRQAQKGPQPGPQVMPEGES